MNTHTLDDTYTDATDATDALLTGECGEELRRIADTALAAMQMEMET